MGLEVVELYMAVEEVFGVEIPDAIASEHRTVGDLYRHLLTLLPITPAPVPEEGRTPDPPLPVLGHAYRSAPPRVWTAELVWEWLRDLVAEELGVPPGKVTPDAHFVQDLGVG